MAGPAAKNAQGLYSIPLIPRSEIPKILTEYQIMNISESDIINPNPNFIFNLFSSLLISLDSLQDDPSQVDFAALDRFDNPDMHVDAVRVMNLFVKIKEVLATIECPLDFSLNDLIRPDSGRTVKFLSAFLNFFFHRDSKLNLLSSYWEQVDALDEQRREKENSISQLKEEISALNDAKEKEKPLVLEAEAKVKELRQTIDSLNTLQSQLRKDRQLMKDNAQEMQANVSKAEFELIQATEENARLRSKVVQSPDKLQRALEDKKAVLAEAKNLERLAMQSFEEKTSMLEVYTKFSEYGLEENILILQCCLDHINIYETEVKSVCLHPAIGLFFRFILDKPNFTSVFCQSLRNVTLRDGFLDDLSNALCLSVSEKVAIGLALSESDNADIRLNGTNFCMSQIEELFADPSTISSTEQIQNIFMFLYRCEGLSKHVDTFTRMLNLMQSKEGIPLILAPLLPNEHNSTKCLRSIDLFYDSDDNDFDAIIAEMEKEQYGRCHERVGLWMHN